MFQSKKLARVWTTLKLCRPYRSHNRTANHYTNHSNSQNLRTACDWTWTTDPSWGLANSETEQVFAMRQLSSGLVFYSAAQLAGIRPWEAYCDYMYSSLNILRLWVKSLLEALAFLKWMCAVCGVVACKKVSCGVVWPTRIGPSRTELLVLDIWPPD